MVAHGAARDIASQQDVDDFVEMLLDPRRLDAVVLVSIAKDESAPYADIERLTASLEPGQLLYVIQTGRLTHRIEDKLGVGVGAYGGAGRVYPLGTEWRSELRLAPLRLCQDVEGGAALTDQLIADLTAPRPKPAARPPLTRRPTTLWSDRSVSTVTPGMIKPGPGGKRVVPAGQADLAQAAPPQDGATRTGEGHDAEAPRTAAPAIEASGSKQAVPVTRPVPKPGPRPQSAESTDPVGPAEIDSVPAASPAGPVPHPTAIGPVVVVNVDDARGLAAHLHQPGRRRPVAVITRAAGEVAPYIDLTELHSAVGDLVEIYEMSTGQVSWAFSHEMEPGTQVYGGASRVYPVGTDWIDDLDLSPLRFAFGAADGARVTAQLIADALRMAHQSGTLTLPASGTAIPADGRVQGIVGGRALVRLANRDQAVIVPELLVDDVPIERIVTKDMTVSGLYDTASQRLDVSGGLRSAKDAVARYRPGDIVVGRVCELGRNSVALRLFPGLNVTISGADAEVGGSASDLRDLASVGEVMRVRVVQTSPWRLSLVGIDPGLPVVAAPSLLDGGPPWVEPAVAAPAPEEIREEPAQPELVAPVPAAPSGESFTDLSAVLLERDHLQKVVARHQHRIERLTGQLEQTRTKLRSATREVQNLEEKLGGVGEAVDLIAKDAAAFLDPADQLRFDVHLAWARRIPAAEKSARPLGRWSIGPQFIDCLDEVQGVDRSKVVDVIVEIVTGLVHEIKGRDLHQLRSGFGGDDAPVTRPDGSTCWRAALQQKTPSARRLHFWMLNDGSIELSSVRLHDDFRA